MYVISPNGVVLHYPTAHHCAFEHGRWWLYTDTKKNDWVATVPCDWAVAPRAPQSTIDDQLAEAELDEIRRSRNESLGLPPDTKTVRLFGFIPLLTIG